MSPRPERDVAGARRERGRTSRAERGTVIVLAVATAMVASMMGVGSVFAAPAHVVAPSTASAGSHTAVVSPSVATLENVTFKALRLPGGSNWTVTAGSPPVTKTDTTVGAKGTIVFAEPNGTLNYTISGPAGWGVQKIEGKGTPSQTSDVINGTTALTVVFAPIVTLSFHESGLAAATTWGISIWSALPHGGPGPQTKSTNTTTLNFTVVKGSYHFNVSTVPAGYRALPPHGSVGAGHAAPKVIRFHQVLGSALFSETGLAHHGFWQVNITGAETIHLSATKSNIRFVLPEGSYTFTVWNFSTHHPVPETGSFTISATNLTVQEKIAYS